MIEIRPCAGMDEFDACVELEVETWGYDETEMIPRKTFLLAQKIGGQVLGAFDTDSRHQGSDKKLLGFAMSLPGIKQVNGHALPYLHSHMLAVKQGHRNRGIGAQLKLEQRREALARGIRHMEWTFDPLQIKNAFLNIHRLGAVVPSLSGEFLWCILISTAGWAPDRPASRRMGVGFPSSSGTSGRASGSWNGHRGTDSGSRLH